MKSKYVKVFQNFGGNGNEKVYESIWPDKQLKIETVQHCGYLLFSLIQEHHFDKNNY